MLYTEVQVV